MNNGNDNDRNPDPSPHSCLEASTDHAVQKPEVKISKSDEETCYTFPCGCRVILPNFYAHENVADSKHAQLWWNGCKLNDRG